MRILHVINILETGGAQSLLLNIIQRWNCDNDTHIVISLMSKNQSAENFEKTGIPVTYIDMIPGKLDFRKFFRLVKFIRLYKPDVVQTWLYHSDLIGGIAAKLSGNVPVIWGVHHTTANETSIKFSTRIVIQLLVILSRFIPKNIICCSNSAYQSHIKLGYPKAKTVTVFNGVDTNLFMPDNKASTSLKKELGLSGETKLIGMFARHHPQKDHRTFFIGAAILIKNHPDTHFILAGEGIELSNLSLEKEIVRAGIMDYVHLLGRRQDMPRLHASVDINSLSSSYGEALPMTLCEGMACGTPCVATDVGDIKMVIGDTGRVVEIGNPQSLASAWSEILDLAESEYQSLSIAARRRIVEFYSISTTVDKYRQVYTKVSSTK